MTLLGVVVAAGVALFLNISYELFYVAVPLIAKGRLQGVLLGAYFDEIPLEGVYHAGVRCAEECRQLFQ